MNKQRVPVTDRAGFLDSHLCDALGEGHSLNRIRHSQHIPLFHCLEVWMNKVLSKRRNKKTSTKHAKRQGTGAHQTSSIAAQLRFSIRYRWGAIAPNLNQHQR